MNRPVALGQIDVDPPLLADDREFLRRELDSWSPCAHGRCLTLAGDAHAADELRQVVGGMREYQLSGMTVARRDDGELFSIRVTNGRVYRKVLHAAAGATHATPDRSARSATVVSIEAALRPRRGTGRPRRGRS